LAQGDAFARRRGAVRVRGEADAHARGDAAQVVAYFNYINRVADALGVDLEPGMPPDRR
jgi:hypothetical protein